MTTEDTLLLEKLSRRKFLALSTLGVWTLPSVLAACQSGSGPSSVTPSPTRVTPGPSPTPSPTGQPLPTDADWAALAGNLQGTLVRPGSPQYQASYKLYSPRFDGIRPAAIA